MKMLKPSQTWGKKEMLVRAVAGNMGEGYNLVGASHQYKSKLHSEAAFQMLVTIY